MHQTTSISAGRPAVKPRPTPGGKPSLPEVGHGHGTKPAFDKPSFGGDDFKPSIGKKPAGEPGIKPGGPYWGGGKLPIDKLPACPIPKGEGHEGKVPGPKFPEGFGEKGEIKAIGPHKVDESLIEKFLGKFKQ